MHESYCEKTTNLRQRTNQHIISESRTGNGSDKFDKHVFRCKQKHNDTKEPLFKFYAFITLRDEKLLYTL